MSKLVEFRKAEEALRRQLALLEDMKKDKELSREVEFEGRLNALLQEYGFSLQMVVDILDPQAQIEAEVQRLLGAARPVVSAEQPRRRIRRVQVWKNPHTGEVLETKSGNNKTLKAWKAEFGESVVAGWLQQD